MNDECANSSEELYSESFYEIGRFHPFFEFSLVANTHFALVVVMLRRFKLIKLSPEAMVGLTKEQRVKRML